MDADPLLCEIAVRGEISNYKLYPSGHHYFTLKDEGASLKCVLFKGNAFRLRFRPENGMKIIAFGKISVYPRDGAYQLYCSAMRVDGIGDLHAAFEQLKKELEARGLFDSKYKKPIPQYPQRIGIVTSAAGAALHDMLRILKKRYPLASVLIVPARVQGAEAPGEIATAIDYANLFDLSDVLIVGRGGGSIEDLWAFNEEIVAQAIFRSRIPVISAVGHEPDVTISDYVADLRAATPSNAAELAVPDCQALTQTLDGFYEAMASAMSKQIKTAKTRLNALSAGSSLQSPGQYILGRANALALQQEKLNSAHSNIINRQKNRYLTLVSKLDAMSPLKVLSRGYGFSQDKEGNVVSSIKQVSIGDTLSLALQDGTLKTQILEIGE